MKNTLPAHAGACLSPKGELAQEHERIGYRLEGEEYFLALPGPRPGRAYRALHAQGYSAFETGTLWADERDLAHRR